MATRSDPIHKIVLKDGAVRWRFVIDLGRNPAGKRQQKTYTFATKREAAERRASLLADKARGVLVRPDKVTLAEHLDAWLAGHRDVKPATLANYRHVLKPVREQLGHLPLQQISKAHIDMLMTRLATSGRRGGSKGRPLAPRTVNLTRTVIRMAIEDALRQGIVARNVAALVRPLKVVKTEMRTWTAQQAATFLEFVAGDRLAVAWLLSLYGLRRSEVLGVRWSDVDLVKGTLTVRNIRVIVDGAVLEGEPKTERGKRTLPLGEDLIAALTALQLRQREEADVAGDAYGTCSDCRRPHIVVDELGDPVHPESYSDRFETLVRRSKLPPIRLHDTRHTCGTLMHLRGVPTAAISAWLGHASADFTMRTYVHSQDEALVAASQTLAGAYVRASATTA